jgi:hypothetical protein
MDFQPEIDSVRWPTIAIAADRGTPARLRLRTAVRRKSRGIRPATPAALQADCQAQRESLMVSHCDNSRAIIWPVASSRFGGAQPASQDNVQFRREWEELAFAVFSCARLKPQPAAFRRIRIALPANR